MVATPSILGDGFRISARHELMRLALSEGRYEQVATQGFAILRHRLPGSGLVAEIRGRLAEALEGLGRLDEARQQRQLAESVLKEAPQDPAWFIHRGRQLDSRRDYASASQIYETGLNTLAPGQDTARTLLTLHLSCSLFMAGRVLDSIQRAEEAVELVHLPEHKFMAHRQAGASYGEAGRLDEAEAHRQSAVGWAETLGDAGHLANALAELADLQRKRGRLVEALSACDRATAETRPARQIEVVRFETLRSWGRFDEALTTLDRVAQLDPIPSPGAERLMQGLFAFIRAAVLMDQGRLADVPKWLNDARTGVRSDAKLSLWRDAAELRLAAIQGRKDLTLDDLRRFESRLEVFTQTQDKNTVSTVLGNLGRAALALGEYGQALDYWRQYLETKPNPVDVPTAHYYIGESHRGLGDESAARVSYREAMATNLETHYVRLAQSRLRTILG
ncbi:tetratricopeptide repeat protein [Singulisphaera sp. GP187]|uniref:tetratricopeptide repeat protein n=1 Tax=Singulisphaera sp. GP187 TaxID=1882752 RepID=UPI000940C4D3|nr:tetratricopeptide repeat protein [Singulisphaera sp. GP187]